MRGATKPIRGILQGSAWLMASSLLVYGLRFGTSVIVAHSLGPAGKGTYVLVITVSAFLGLFFNFGLGGAITYFTASRSFEEKEIYAFATYAAAAWGALAAVVFVPLYTFWLSDNLLAGLEPAYIWLVVGLLPLSLWSSFLGSMLLGRQLMAPYSLTGLVQVGLNFGLQLIAFLAGWGLPGAVLSWAVAVLVGLLTPAWFTRRAANVRIAAVGKLLRPALQYGIKSYIANLLTFFNYRLDSFLVNAFSGAGAVGLYSTSVSTAEILYYLPNAVSGALFPKVAGLEPETASALTARLARIVLAVLLPAAALFGWAGTWLIPGIFGKPFHSAVQAFVLLLPGIVGIALSKILSADLSGRGKPQYASYTALITLGVTISLDLLLIPRWGINGAAVASSVAYLSSAGLLALWFCSVTGTRLRQLLVPTAADVELVVRQVRNRLRRA